MSAHIKIIFINVDKIKNKMYTYVYVINNLHLRNISVCIQEKKFCIEQKKILSFCNDRILTLVKQICLFNYKNELTTICD